MPLELIEKASLETSGFHHGQYEEFCIPAVSSHGKLRTFFGLCPSSGILRNIKEHNVSETGCFLLQVRGWETLTCWVC
jgi:hypothetical protein